MKTVELGNLQDDYERARKLVSVTLTKRRVSNAVISETLLVFEALCHEIFEQKPKDAVVTVATRDRLGNAALIISYEGPMFDPEASIEDPFSPEGKILAAYADRVDYTYSSRFNSIKVQARRSYAAVTLSLWIAMLLGIFVYANIHAHTDAQTEATLLKNIVYPLQQLFGNAILMIGAPMTFLSLLKNLSSTYILGERNSGIHKIMMQTITSSALSVFLAISACQILELIFKDKGILLKGYSHMSMHMKLSGFIMELVPSDIFTPFQTISPFPLIIIAIVMTYAFCSAGKYFDSMMHAIDVLYSLVSRMLGILMSALPFFTFFAVLDILLRNGYPVLRLYGGFVLLMIACLILPMTYYLFRLIARGINLRGFHCRIVPLLNENYRIASALDAVPYNIRYLVKYFGFNRKQLESTMPVLAQLNLDGNCFLITLMSVVFVSFSSTENHFGDMLLIGMLVFFLSLGAPNQPGSCLIGTLIILNYLEAPSFIPFAIFAEVFFGPVQNIMNVLGDIVTEVVNQKPDLSKMIKIPKD